MASQAIDGAGRGATRAGWVMLFNLKILFYLDALFLLGLLTFRASLLPRFRDVVGTKAVTLVLLTPAVALLSGNIYVFHAYLFCAVAFTSRTRLDLGGTYLLMLPMAPSLQFDLYGGGIYLLAVQTYLSMNAGALVGMLLTPGTGRRGDPLLDLSVLLLTLVFIYVDMRDVSVTAVLRFAVQTALTLLPPYLVISRAATDVHDVRRLFVTVALAAYTGAIIAIFMALRRWDFYDSFYPLLGQVRGLGSSFAAVRGGFLRAGGPIGDYSVFGLFLASSLLILLTLRGAFRPNRRAVIGVVVAVGLIATQSRGAWVAFVVGYAALCLMRERMGRAAAAIAVPVAAYPVLSVVLPSTSKLGDTLGLGGSGSSTSDYRQLLLSRGLEQVRAYPLFGQSPQRLIANLTDLVQGQHIVDFVNTHLWVAMTAGLPGFAVWTIVWGSAIWRLVRRRRQGDVETRRSGILAAPAAAMVACLVGLTFTSAVERNLFWPLLALGFATPVLAPVRGARKPLVTGDAEARATPTSLVKA